MGFKENWEKAKLVAQSERAKYQQRLKTKWLFLGIPVVFGAAYFVYNVFHFDLNNACMVFMAIWILGVNLYAYKQTDKKFGPYLEEDAAKAEQQ